MRWALSMLFSGLPGCLSVCLSKRIIPMPLLSGSNLHCVSFLRILDSNCFSRANFSRRCFSCNVINTFVLPIILKLLARNCRFINDLTCITCCRLYGVCTLILIGSNFFATNGKSHNFGISSTSICSISCLTALLELAGKHGDRDGYQNGRLTMAGMEYGIFSSMILALMQEAEK